MEGSVQTWLLSMHWFGLRSLVEFSKIYARLGVTIKERGESFYQPMMAAVVKELEEKSKHSGRELERCKKERK